MNVIEVAFAGTVTDGAATGNRWLSLASPTTVPPFGAGLLKVTVHFVVAPEFRLQGLHVNDDIMDDPRLSEAVCDEPLRLAVRVAL